MTRLLDESPARIKMLVAPAGYGKTTLARQWLATGRASAWLQCGPQSADVAELLDELAGLITLVAPIAGPRLRDRLRSTTHPARELDVLTEILLEDLQHWPSEAWLVVEDYQFIADSPAAEFLFAGLASASALNLLICGRRRPGWATARRVVYGEIADLGKSELAMTAMEGRELLGPAPRRDAVLELARGWPALLSLATFVDSERWRLEPLPTTIYSFLAEEIYSSLSPEVRHALPIVALGANLTTAQVRGALGTLAETVIGEGLVSGMIDISLRTQVIEI
ncbi:MAG: hypothetical protein H0T13_04125, partial [Actinobacteria bacterium]|nr:hypothetical protein [Actinomycetota bacterium]